MGPPVEHRAVSLYLDATRHKGQLDPDQLDERGSGRRLTAMVFTGWMRPESSAGALWGLGSKGSRSVSGGLSGVDRCPMAARPDSCVDWGSSPS